MKLEAVRLGIVGNHCKKRREAIAHFVCRCSDDMERTSHNLIAPAGDDRGDVCPNLGIEKAAHPGLCLAKLLHDCRVYRLCDPRTCRK
jgi:hypothetical protein